MWYDFPGEFERKEDKKMSGIIISAAGICAVVLCGAGIWRACEEKKNAQVKKEEELLKNSGKNPHGKWI